MMFYKVCKSNSSEFFTDSKVSIEEAVAKIKSKLFGYDERYKILSKVSDDLAGCAIVRAQAQNSLSIETMLLIESDTHYSICFIDNINSSVTDIE